MMEQIEALRVIVQRLHAADTATLHALLVKNQDDLLRWMPGALVPADCTALAGVLEGQATYGIYRPGDPTLLGAVSLAESDEPRVFVLGYWLDEDARGDGLAAAAAAALTRACFDFLAAVRVEIHCLPTNERSARVAARIGCQRHGALLYPRSAAAIERWVASDAEEVARRAGPITVLGADHVPLDTPSVPTEERAWSDLTRFLAHHLEISGSGKRWLTVRPVGERGAPGVTVTLGAACHRPWIILTAPVGDGDALDPRMALRHNAELATGALILCPQRQVYLLRHAMPLEGTYGWALRQAIDLLTREAQQLATAVCSRPANLTAFVNYAD